MKPKSPFATTKGRLALALILLLSISGYYYASNSYQEIKVEEISDRIEINCVVEAGPNNDTGNPTYQLDCNQDEIVIYQNNLKRNSKYTFQTNYTRTNLNYSAGVGFYFLTRQYYEIDNPSVFYDSDLHIENGSQQVKGDINIQDNYRFVICVCSPEIDPISYNPSDPENYEYGLNFTNILEYKLKITKAPFFNQYTLYILSYIAILLLIPHLIHQIQLNRWEKENVNKEEDSLMEEVRDHYER